MGKSPTAPAAAVLAVLSLAVLAASSSSEVPNVQVTTVAPSTVDPTEERRKPAHLKPRPSVTAYYPYPYQLSNRPQRPSKFQAANQVYGYPFAFRRGIYPTIMRRQSGPSIEERRRAGQVNHPHHAAEFHAINQQTFSEPVTSRAQQTGAKRVPCNRQTVRRRPHPTCTIWPAGAGGGVAG